MKKILLSLLAGSFMIAFASCSDSENREVADLESQKDKPSNILDIYPFIEGKEELERNWKDGNTLGLFVTKGRLNEPYMDEIPYHTNLKAKYYGDLWFMPTDVELTDEPAYIFAYSPYIAECNPFAIPVECNSGTDYLFGTHFGEQKIDPNQTFVSKGRNKACLKMRHALGMLQVYIKKEGGVQPISVEKVEFRPVEGSSYEIPTEGILNVQSGKLTNTHFGNYSQNITDWTLGNEFTEKDRRDFPCIPQIFETGNIELAVTIGGIEYTKTIEKGEWKRGYKYAFRIKFTGTKMELKDVVIKPWETVGDIIVDIVDKAPEQTF